MTVQDVVKDTEALTMTLTAQFDAPPERVWQVWSDPRQLERWWGPPGYPATVTEHELAPGGTVRYFMTSPEGERYHGLWRVVAVEEPTLLEFEDSFADESGAVNTQLPTSGGRVTLAAAPGGGTTMTISTRFPSREAMEQLVAMGMEQGITLAVGQIDAIIAGVAAG